MTGESCPLGLSKLDSYERMTKCRSFLAACAVRRPLLCLAWLCLGLGVAQAQISSCQTSSRIAWDLQLSDLNDLQLKNVVKDPLAQSTCHNIRLLPGELLARPECQGSERWLLLEFYRLAPGSDANASWVLDPAPANDIYFMAARGDTAPTMSVNWWVGKEYPSPDLNLGVFVSNPPATDPGGNAGTFLDANGINYMRSYQRLLIPNITVPINNKVPVWWMTVGNLAWMSSSGAPRMQGYGIRGTCMAAADVPCPRPLLNKGACSDVGTCSPVADVTMRTCQCPPKYGDYGCNKPLSSLSTGQTDQVSLLPGVWQWWKVQVPLFPSGPLNQVLLVDFKRSSNSDTGADPLLLVKPVVTDDMNTPFYADFQTYSDVSSWNLQQNYHYHVQRDFGSGATASGDFYVAVFNYNSRFVPGGQLIGTVSVRWGTSATPFVCPADCSNRGRCLDPKATASTNDVASAVTIDRNQGFICDCSSSDVLYGGLLCEAALVSVPVTQSTQTVRGSLQPGQWSYIQLPLDAHKFNNRTDDLMLAWAVADVNGPIAQRLSNALLTFNEDQYPQQAQYLSNQPYKNGTVYSFRKLIWEEKEVLQYDGSTLRVGVTYMVGIYNSEYLRSSPYSYSLDVWVPSTSASWLHPYMSVVLGVTAAVVLCLFMTLCKRLVVRNGWGPWGRRGHMPDHLEGDGMPRHAMVQILPRHQGVPQSTMQRFPTYEYISPPVTGKTVPLDVEPIDGGDLRSSRATGPPGLARRSQREALQAAAAEAATTAAAAVRMIAEQQQQQPQAGAAAADAVSEPNRLPAAGAGAAPGAPEHPLHTPVLSDEQAAAMAAAAKGAAAAHHQQAISGSEGAAVAASVEGAKLPPLNVDGEEAPTCTVCLCEYEEGDIMRRLPCTHEFHRACIDKWMSQHTTCPMCREPLVGAEELAAHQEQSRNVAVIYIPQAYRRGTHDGNEGRGAGTGGGTPGSRGAENYGGFMNWWNRQLGGQDGAAGSGRARSEASPGAQQMVMHQDGARAWNGQSPSGWHVTMAWGSTQDGPADPFASPLPMNSSGARRAVGGTEMQAVALPSPQAVAPVRLQPASSQGRMMPRSHSPRAIAPAPPARSQPTP